MIQDYILAACAVVFFIGLLPQVISHYKTKKVGIVLYTSVPTALAMWTLVGCTLSLKLWFASSMNALNAILWTIIIAQTIKYGRK